MSEQKYSISEIEKKLQEQFNPEHMTRFVSTAKEPNTAAALEDLKLPEDQRGPMPFTRDKYIVNEDPAQVEWEREIRKFLRRLNTDKISHRVSAVMIYEWTTGISLKDLREAEGVDETKWQGGAANGSANRHLRIINKILREYFGTPYKTKIMGREVGKAYTVGQNFRVKRKKPISVTLLPDYMNGTLD